MYIGRIAGGRSQAMGEQCALYKKSFHTQREDLSLGYDGNSYSKTTNMTRPCPICQKRKERKLKKEISKSKKENKKIELQNEKTRKEISMLQKNFATVESYWNARRARGGILLDDTGLMEEGERKGEEEQEEALDLSK